MSQTRVLHSISLDFSSHTSTENLTSNSTDGSSTDFSDEYIEEGEINR